MPDKSDPVVGERVRVKVGLTTVEGTVTDTYQASSGLRVVVETIEDDPEFGRQLHTIAVPVEQIRRGPAGKFVLKKGHSGKFHFNLVAGNGQVIATSQSYETKASALNGIRSVQVNAPEAEVESVEAQPD